MIRISQKIVGQTVVKPGDEAETEKPELEELQETTERPEHLEGSTYRIKAPVMDHAMYVTVNDIVLNAGTEHETRRPFEIFINSKNMDSFQWVVALTRVMSAVFRKGGNCTFLIEELRSVFDPRGGYFKKGGRYMNSVVAEIGDVVEQHLRKHGTIVDSKPAEPVKQEPAEEPSGVAGAKTCPKCFEASLVVMDGCATCLSCGDSKCG